MARTKKTVEAVETVETEAAEKKTKKVEVRKGWNSTTPNIPMNRMYIEILLTEKSLGTSPSNKELLTEYIASRAPDAKSREEEIAAIGTEEAEKKQTTIFPKGYFLKGENKYIDVLDAREGTKKFQLEGIDEESKQTLIRLPFMWNYQVRGFFKDSCGLLSRGGAKYSSAMKAYKKVIDGNIFVHPRRIAWNLPEFYFNDEGMKIEVNPENLKVFQRPLRTSGPSGERSAIAASEELPAGSSCKFYIEYLDPKMHDLIVEWLNYGCMHGLGAWRNSGRGIFIWRELKEDYSDYSNETDEE